MRRNRHVAVVFGCVGVDGRRGGRAAAVTTTAAAAAPAARPRAARPAAPRSSTRSRWTAPRARSRTAPARTPSGEAKASIKGFNEKFESQGLSAKLVEFPADARQQRQQFVQRQEAKSGECDVFSSDVVWTAEFANQKWLYDLTPYVRAAQGRLHPGDAQDGHLRRQDAGACRTPPTRRSSTTTRTRPRRFRPRGRSCTPRPSRRTASSTRAPPTRA